VAEEQRVEEEQAWWGYEKLYHMFMLLYCYLVPAGRRELHGRR
jgi:hypothetical protein